MKEENTNKSQYQKGRLLLDTPSARRWKRNINLGASIAVAHTAGWLVIDSDNGRTPNARGEVTCGRRVLSAWNRDCDNLRLEAPFEASRGYSRTEGKSDMFGTS